MSLDLIIEIAGFLLGLLYLWYEFHADRRMWPVGMIMPLVSMWLYFSKGLYADFAMNIYYFLMGVYGFVAWSRGGGHDEKSVKGSPLRIRHIPVRYAAGAIGVGCCIWVFLAEGLMGFTDSTVPWADGFTTAFSIVSTWLLARKFLEQWVGWFVVDVVCVYLYIYKGIYFYAVLYAVYSLLAVLGYMKWRRMMKE